MTCRSKPNTPSQIQDHSAASILTPNTSDVIPAACLVTRAFWPFFSRLFDHVPVQTLTRTFTIGLYEEKPTRSEVIILECSFPLTTDESAHTRAAGRGGASQASYEKRRHRNCFQRRPWKHFQKSKHLLRSEVSWCDQTHVDLQLHRSTCLASRILSQKEPFPRSEFAPGHLWTYSGMLTGRSPKCRISTTFSKSFDHHGKTKKRIFEREFRKTKKPELPQKSVSSFDQKVFDYALEDACVKVANVKSGKKNARQGYVSLHTPKSPEEHPACPIFSAVGGEGRGGDV